MDEFDSVIQGYSDGEVKVEKDKTAVMMEAVLLVAVLAVLLLLVTLITAALVTALIWFIVSAWDAILN